VYAPVVSVNLSTYFVEELRHNSATGITVVGNSLANIIIGNVGSDYLVGFGGNDTLTGGTGAANTLQGGLGDDTYVLSALGDTALEFAGEGNDTVRTDLSVHTLRVNIENMVYTGVGPFTGTGNASANTITGGAGNDTLNGAGGADIINGGGGSDLIIQSSTAGSDFIDGGADSDTIRIDGDATSEAFVIYTRDAAITTGGISAASLNVNTEIVIVRNGTVISELDNVEEILINTLDVSANDGNGSPNGGAASGDTVTVVGDFTTTSLDYSTITINGGTANDTVDIGGLTSDHRIVFNSGGGTDNVVGGLRPQDVFNGSAQASEANMASVFEQGEPVTRYGDMRGLHTELTEISLMPLIA
jgi:hypothetical protein